MRLAINLLVGAVVAALAAGAFAGWLVSRYPHPRRDVPATWGVL